MVGVSESPFGSAVQTIDEKHAVEVVGLVLDGPGQSVGALDRDRVAIHVLTVGDNMGLAHAVEGEPGYGQASFGAVLLLRGREMQYRVDEVALLVLADVVGEHSQSDADLVRGQPGPGGGQHRLLQIGDQAAQLGVEDGDRLSRGAQDRVPEQANGLRRHGESLGERVVGKCPSPP